jgi:hypothetical protein
LFAGRGAFNLAGSQVGCIDGPDVARAFLTWGVDGGIPEVADESILERRLNMFFEEALPWNLDAKEGRGQYNGVFTHRTPLISRGTHLKCHSSKPRYQIRKLNFYELRHYQYF